MAGKKKPGKPVKGINIKLKMINDLMDVTGSAKDSWNPAEISDDMKAIAYIHDLADTWNPAQLNEALKYLGFATIDSWNPAIIEETKNKLVNYFLPTEVSGNPVTFNTYGNLPYEVSKAEVTFLPKQSGTGDPAPDNVRPITGYTEITLTVSNAATDPTQTETYTETLGQTVYGGNVDFVSGGATVNYDKITFDGTESWVYSVNRYQLRLNGIMKSGSYYNDDNVLCSAYPKSATLDVNNTVVIGYNSDYIYFYATEGFPTLNDWKTRLQQGDIELTYLKATPTEVTLTPEQISLLKGNNVLSTDGDTINITYKAILNS